MATRSNPYYNDPNLAKAFNNLAGMFAPPGGTDLAGYATAAAKNAETERLKWLYENAADPLAAQRSAVLGIQSYGNTQQGFMQTDATNRRGQDVTAATSTSNNARDNARQMAQTRYGALSEGQTLPAMPQSVASMYGLPAAETPQAGIVKLNQNQVATNVPGVGTLQGNMRPTTMDEWQAMQLERLRTGGTITDQQIADMAFGKQAGTPVQAIDPNTKQPVFMAPGQAVRVGAAPIQDTTKQTNATGILPDGRQVPARQGPDAAWYHAQTGERLPNEVRVLDMAKPQGSNEQLGITQSNVTDATKRSAEVTRTLHLLDMYEGLINKNPGAIGLVGLARGTAQNAASTINDLTKAFGKDAPEIEGMASDLRAGLQKVQPGLFDPSIPEADFLQGALAYGLARTENPSGEVSRQAYEAAKSRIQGGGMLANTDSARAQINAFRNVLRGELQAIGTLRNPATGRTDVGGSPNAAPSAQPQQPAAPVERWTRDPSTGRLVKVAQ